MSELAEIALVMLIILSGVISLLIITKILEYLDR